MRNLIITAILTTGLLIPSASFAAYHPFGVNTESMKKNVHDNIQSPSYTTDELSIKTQAQELQGDKREVSKTDFNIADYFFGVDFDARGLS